MDSNEGLDFDKFLKIVQGQRDTNIAVVDDTDTVEAFVALGGKVRRPCDLQHLVLLLCKQQLSMPD